MLKKIDQVLAALGNLKAMQRLHVDTFFEERMNNVRGEKIAESGDGQLYTHFGELNGYLFMDAVIFSRTNIKTLKGATFTFDGKDTDLVLNSDTKEIESDYSNVSDRFMTNVTFYIDEKELDLIKKRNFDTVRITFKKKGLTFNKVLQ